MRPLLLFLALCGLLLAGCASDEPQAPPATAETDTSTRSAAPSAAPSARQQAPQQAPQAAPEVTVTTLGGQTINLGDPEGVLLVNFWATWCGPCRIEIPDLIALQDELGPQGLTIVGVAVGESESLIRPFAEQMEITYPLVADADRRVAQAFGGIYGLPTTLVIDADGQIVERILGLFPIDRMKPRLEPLLEAGR